jgi:transposase
MVLESEAVCSRCCNKHGYTINLKRDNVSQEFYCPNCKTYYRENGDGYLVSKR